jgi:phytoene/squalene synthetase
MFEIYEKTSIDCSKKTTNNYSTSFSLGIKMIGKSHRWAIYGIYGFVRLADEIVDTFDREDKAELLAEFKADTYKAIEKGISLNPILNAFQEVVNKYEVDHELIDTFLYSMEMDLDDREYDQSAYEKYILGSAEVVGLMCLKVFVEGDPQKYEELKPYAMKLGSAFQKINFLRDYKVDTEYLGRIYFPQLQFTQMDQQTKLEIERDIEKDFAVGYEGIKRLPKDARFGVYVAYIYYSNLLHKIMEMPAQQIMQERVRIPNNEKYALFFGSYLRHSFNLL